MRRALIFLFLVVLFASSCKGNDALVLEPKAELLDLIYGDRMEGFYLCDSHGEEIQSISSDSGHTIIIYLTDNCKSCIELVRDINIFLEMFTSEKLNYFFIWQDDIPVRVLEKYNIPIDNNLSLAGKYKLSSITPTMFIINEDREVMFVSNEVEQIMEKLILDKIVDIHHLREKANKYLLKKNGDREFEKPTLVMFSMEGCPDCIKADKIIEDYKIANSYNILKVYREGTDESLGMVDVLSVFKKIYEIDWYPTFVKLKNSSDLEIIREVPEETMLDMLLN